MTRMWCVNPSIMCQRHLSGEWHELFLIVGCLNKNKKLDGYYSRGEIQTNLIKKRYEELLKEGLRRKYNFISRLPEFNDPNLGFVDSDKNLKELCERCPECRKLILGEKKC